MVSDADLEAMCKKLLANTVIENSGSSAAPEEIAA